VNVDLRYVGSRYAQQYSAAIDSIQVQQVAAEKTLNLSLTYSFPTVLWTLGVSNLTDANVLIPQPYNDVSTPFPAGGREYWLRAEIIFQ
jgi:outer membrane receptor protein involved in Fe transport